MEDDLRPLLAGDLEPQLRGALEAAMDDGPSLEQIERATLALGLGIGAAKVALGGATGHGLVKGASSLWFVKWFGLGLLVGGLTSSGAALLERSEARPTSQTAPGEGGTVQAAPAQTPAVLNRALDSDSEPAAPDAPRASGAARQLSPVTTSAPVDSAPPVESAPGPSAASFPEPRRQADLGVEVALIDAVRRKLSAGDAQGALGELGRYDALTGPKRLGPEALVLRVRALMALGRVHEAQALAKAFIERRPSSSHAKQLRAAARL